MSEQNKEINIIELLMGIKEDVSSIKTDMANFKEAQRTEKDVIMKEISDVRTDYQRDLADLESGDVDNLKTAEDKKFAKRYRTMIAFVLTALGGMALAKLPDFVVFMMKVKGQ